MPPISATLITYNEARNIERAIRSLTSVDEIVIVDSGSSDNTQEIARSLGARVIQNKWPGYAAQKQFAVDQARHDWILSLDADEELDTVAQGAIARWKLSDPTATGYRWARRAFYLGRWIFHSGWYPDYKVRLFDRRRAGWQGDYVHESVVVNGSVGTLEGDILHYTCDSLDEHRARIEVYTDLAARELHLKGRRANWLQRSVVPAWVFFLTYFLRLGLLDGHQGYLIASMAAWYVRRKYQKLAELSRKEQGASGQKRS